MISLLGVIVFYILLGSSSVITFLLKIIVLVFGVVCSTRNTYVKSSSTEGTCITSICTRIAFIRDIYIGDTCAKNAYIRVAFDKGICNRSICAIEYWKISL